MPSIYIAATVLTLAITGVFSILLLKFAPKELRKPLLLLALFELPMEPLSIMFFRAPLDQVIKAVLGPGALYDFATTFYAPLTEEIFKLIPVVVFFINKKIKFEDLRFWMIPIGFGFGIGEAWMLASLLVHVPAVAQSHWYDLDGFLMERAMVCFIHGGMCGAGLYFSLGKGRWALGTLLSMTLHFLGNIPIFLLGPKVWNVSAPISQMILLSWTTLYCVLSIVLVLALGNKKKPRAVVQPVMKPDTPGDFHPLDSSDSAH